MNRRRLKVIRVWLGVRSGWWRWHCPCCPRHAGGFCLTWRQAYDTAVVHASGHVLVKTGAGEGHDYIHHVSDLQPGNR